MKTILAIVKKILFLFGALFLWLVFAYKTLYRDEWAIQSSGGNPLPNEWTFILLPIIVMVVFHEGFTAKGLWKILFNSLIIILSLIGILFFITTVGQKP